MVLNLSGRPVRAFLAVALEGEAREVAVRARRALEATGAGASWVADEDLHVTLRFLGPSEPAALQAFGALLEAPLADVRPFDAALDGLGVFPGRENAKVAWAGIGRGAETLARLAAISEAAARAAGFAPEDRPFRPHVTLARLRSVASAALLLQALSQESPRVRAPFRVNALTLFESLASPVTPRYRALARFELRSA